MQLGRKGVCIPTGVGGLEVQTEHQESDRSGIDSPETHIGHPSGASQRAVTVTEGEKRDSLPSTGAKMDRPMNG